MSRKSRAGWRKLGWTMAALAIGIAAVTGVSTAAAGATAQPGAQALAVHTLLSGRSASAGAAVNKFWTPKRLASAKSLDGSAPSRRPPSAGQTPSAGQSPSAGQVEAPARTTNAVRPATYVPPALPPSEGAAQVGVSSTVGRVFFTDSAGGVYACSGSSVTSEAGDMVLTAGHCVFGGSGLVNDFSVPRNWYGNWVYVPGYYVDGSGYGHEPYGGWDAWAIATSSAWITSADESQDIGFGLVVRNSSNQALTTVVGGQGLTWDQPLYEPVTAYGYPVNPSNPAAPVGVKTCVSSLGMYYSVGSIICGLGPGASGGPWLVNQDAWGMGYVAGINTVWYPGLNLMDSPWFSTNVLTMYTSLRNS